MSDKITAEINLMENATYVVVDGVLHTLHSPPSGKGEQVIIWENEKVQLIRHHNEQRI